METFILLFRGLMMWVSIYFSPERIKLREIDKIRNLKKSQHKQVEQAIAKRDTARLSKLLKDIQ